MGMSSAEARWEDNRLPHLLFASSSDFITVHLFNPQIHCPQNAKEETEFYSGGWAFELLTFAGIALILPQTASQKVMYELGLVRRDPPPRSGGTFPHSWGCSSLGISIFQEELSSGFSSQTFAGINRWLNGNRNQKLFYNLKKLSEGLLRQETRTQGLQRKSERKTPRSCCCSVRELGKPSWEVI